MKIEILLNVKSRREKSMEVSMIKLMQKDGKKMIGNMKENGKMLTSLLKCGLCKKRKTKEREKNGVESVGKGKKKGQKQSKEKLRPILVQS